MANFAVIVDADPARRLQYLERIGQAIAPCGGLIASRLEHGPFAAAWATTPSAPVTHHADDGRVAILWGRALSADSAKPIAAADLGHSWDPALRQTPGPLDGYYAALVLYHNTLIAGADLLGLFPVYYAASAEAIVVSSTPGLIRLHPALGGRLSEEGLVGILLTDAMVDNRTLWQGVHRLAAGHALIWRQGVGAHEISQYEIPLSDRDSRSTFREQIDLLDQAMEHASRRHTPREEPHGIMLSGGRDSRMLAGYLERQGRTARALTMGGARDFDVVCARRLSRVLEWKHRRVSVDPAEFVQNAMLHAHWDHLSSGFNSPHLWGMIEPLRELAPSFTHGYIAGFLAGGEGITVADRPTRVVSWRALFPPLNARGIDVGTLKRLLAFPNASDLIDSVTDRIRTFYEKSCSIEEERLWRFQLASTARLGVGSIPSRLSFGSWPVLPLLDRRVLAAVAILPADSMGSRRAQDEIIRSRFPHLARVEVVVGNIKLDPPLLPTRGYELRRRMLDALLRLRVKRRHRDLRTHSYNWNMYDFDSPGWRAVRQRAEVNRHRLDGLVDLEELAKVLPPPDQRVPWTFTESMGRKLLVGLLLWSETHL